MREGKKHMQSKRNRQTVFLFRLNLEEQKNKISIGMSIERTGKEKVKDFMQLSFIAYSLGLSLSSSRLSLKPSFLLRPSFNQSPVESKKGQNFLYRIFFLETTTRE